MKVTETITITREVNGSTGYGTFLAALENLALVSIDTDPPVPGIVGAPVKRHWTFLAIAPGKASVQFARLRPWDPATLLYEDVLPIDVEPAYEAEDAAGVNVRPGGWTPFAKPDDDADALKVFKEAFAKLVGVDYEPLLVTRQAVNGANFIFAVNAKVVYPNAVPYGALVRIYKPAEGEAKIVKITSLGSPSPHFVGGYGAFRELNDSDKAVLKAAFKKFVGAKYTADYVSTQVVAGRNYRFIGTQTLSAQGKPAYPVLFTVYQPHSGGVPVFTGSQKVYELV